jgi:cyclase
MGLTKKKAQLKKKGVSIINTALYKNINFIKKPSSLYGNQCLIASIDFQYINKLPIGEIILNSITKDGTGQGYDFSILNFINNNKKPIIFSGSAGNSRHLYVALKRSNIEAAATGDLFNFINYGLINTIANPLNKKIKLANWNLES